MFFAQDVLFRNGPLALLWMAGNGELSGKDAKTKRKKQYLMMINCNMVELSELIRKYFPEMSSANGLSFKKMSILVKGLGVIYFSKMDNLLASMLHLKTKMRIQVLTNQKIDLPKDRRRKNDDQVEEEVQNVGFGDLNEFGMLTDGCETGPRYFPANILVDQVGFLEELENNSSGPSVIEPRKKKSRRDATATDNQVDVDEHQVLQLLRNATENQDPHCILDPDPPISTLGGGPAFDNFEFDEFRDGDTAEPINNNMHSNRELPYVAVPEVVSGLNSPTGKRELDDGESRSGRKRQRRRSRTDSEFETDNQVIQAPAPEPAPQLQLEVLQAQNSRSGGGRRRGRARRLKLDVENQIPMAEILKAVEQQRRQLSHEDYDALQNVLAQSRATPAKYLFSSAQQLLQMTGRRVLGGTLSRFAGQLQQMAIDNIHRRAERHRQVDNSQQQTTADTFDRPTDSRSAVDVVAPETRDFGPSDIPIDVEPPLMENNMPPQDDQLLVNEVELPFPPPSGIDMGPPLSDFGPPSSYIGPAGNVDISSLDDDGTAFTALFPPGQVSRKTAASGFFQLLKMHKSHTIRLEQNEPYGRILVIKL